MFAIVLSGPYDPERQAGYHGGKRKEVEEECRWDDVDEHQKRQRNAHQRKQETDKDQAPRLHGVIADSPRNADPGCRWNQARGVNMAPVVIGTAST